MFGRTLLVFLGLLSVPSVALAQDDAGLPRSEGQSWERPLEVWLHAGSGTPYGMAGVEAVWSPIPWFTVNGGVGMGFGRALQVGGMVRGRVPISHVALSFGLGASYGDSAALLVNRAEDAVWLNADVALEYRKDNGVSFKLYLGTGTLLRSRRCTDDDNNGSECPEALPYVGMAFGRAF